MKTKIRMKKAYNSCSNATSLANRLQTIFKKSQQLSVLCEIDVCVIYYGPDGVWKTWPQNREHVEAMARNYEKATKRKKCVNLDEFLEKEKKEKEKEKGKKNGKKNKYPNLEHYSSQQLSQLIQSLERTLFTLQERLRFVETQKQMNMNLIHQTQNPPSNFSMINYKHEETPLSPAAPQLNSYQNDLMMQKELYGFGQNNITTNTNFQMQQQQMLYGFDQDNITNTNFQMEEQVLYGFGHNNNITNTNFQMQEQQMLYGFDQDMYIRSDIINNNVFQSLYPSNTAPLPLPVDFQNFPYGGNMNCNNTHFSQDIF